MKKKLLLPFVALLLALPFFATEASAQSTFHKNDKIFTLNLGLIGDDLDNLKVPPISGIFEYCVASNIFNNGNGSIGLGAIGGYYATGSHSGKAVRAWTNHGILGGRASLHYQLGRKADVYTGVFMGLSFLQYRATIYDDDIYTKSDTESDFGWGVHLGCRYYFTPNVALNFEVGSAFSNLSLGVTFKL